jgi:DNA polymerase-3 subunit beta
VPARTLAETAKALAASGDVTIALAAAGGGPGDGLMGFEGGGRTTTTRLLEGEFPKYRSLLPSESASIATVETAPFVEAVKRVALVAERNTPIRLAFAAGEVVLEAGAGDEAQASEAMSAELTGDDISIAFNPGYLLDGLGAIASSHAQLAFTTPSKPAVITSGASGSDGDSEPAADYRYLIMPVRLSG